MNEHIEVEARWINLDQGEIEKKLKEIGAKQTGNFFYNEWLFGRDGWFSTHRRIRVRTDGTNHSLTYKANVTWEIDSTEEVKLKVDSAENAVKFLQAADVPLRRYQEKKRIRYELDDITFDLDFWPQIPMVLEIEAPSEKRVKEGAELLELSWNDVLFEDQKVVHEKYYNIDLNEITDYRF